MSTKEIPTEIVGALTEMLDGLIDITGCDEDAEVGDLLELIRRAWDCKETWQEWFRETMPALNDDIMYSIVQFAEDIRNMKSENEKLKAQIENEKDKLGAVRRERNSLIDQNVKLRNRNEYLVKLTYHGTSTERAAAANREILKKVRRILDPDEHYSDRGLSFIANVIKARSLRDASEANHSKRELDQLRGRIKDMING